MKLCLIATLLAASTSMANVFFTPRSEADLVNPSPDVLFRIKNCHVAWMDARALKRDFEFLQGQSDRVVKQWVLDNFCYMSAKQLHLEGFRCTGMNSVCDRSQTKYAFRQPGWNRVATVPAKDLEGEAIKTGSAMVDVKGIGQETDPEIVAASARFKEISGGRDGADRDAAMMQMRQEFFKTGLLELYDAIKEIAFANAIQQAFIERNRGVRDPLEHLQVVEPYFLIAHDVNTLGTRGEKIQSFLLGRQGILLLYDHQLTSAHVGRSYMYPGTDGIYEDYVGKYQADAFGAGIDMGHKLTVEHPALSQVLGMNAEEQSQFLTTFQQRYMQGDTDALYAAVDHAVSPFCSTLSECPLDTRPKLPFKEALLTQFGRGPYRNLPETLRQNTDKYGHAESEQERQDRLKSVDTYNSITYDKYGDYMWDKWANSEDFSMDDLESAAYHPYPSINSQARRILHQRPQATENQS